MTSTCSAAASWLVGSGTRLPRRSASHGVDARLFGQHEDRWPTHGGPRAERARGDDCGGRQGLAAGMTTVFGHYPTLRRAAQLWIRVPIAATIECEKFPRDGWYATWRSIRRT